MDYEQLYGLILDDELGWEHLISTIIREEGMDPLDIDLVKIADKFSDLVLKLKAIDFRFGGKFVYTAAILLKMKSDKVIDELLNRQRLKQKDQEGSKYIRATPFGIIVASKLPLSRSRRITLTELINTIREAMKYTVKHKINFELKLKEIKIEQRIIALLERLSKMFSTHDYVTLSELVPKKDRKEVVYTFLPLLFLANMGKVELEQAEPFEEVYVRNKRKS
jgi:segregation and condensation protein A